MVSKRASGSKINNLINRTMQYYFSTVLNTNFKNAEAIIIEVLKTEGFGIISEIDMRSKLKEKLGVDFRKYKILGACNPSFAYKALQVEEKIGVMLPCNIVIMDKENGTTEVTAINPIASMMAIQNPALEPLANEITEKLKRVIEALV
jgi:uncharacterized protein (DUF302 family)